MPATPTTPAPAAPPTPLHYPHSTRQLTFHPSLCAVVDQYASRKQIMHTLFYGPASSGKLTLARRLVAKHTGLSEEAVDRQTRHHFVLKDKEFVFYKTPVHFEMNVADFLPNHQKALIELLREIAKTLNVSRNTYKLIILQNADELSRSVQHQLRRMMEVFYSTCRLLFLSHSLDRIDQTLQSRFVCMRVPRPRTELMAVDSQALPSVCAQTVHEWLGDRAKEDASEVTVTDHAVQQLWRALLRKALPVQTIRKWVRVISMTRLAHADILQQLLLKLLAKSSGLTTPHHQRLCALTNYYIHQHALMQQAHNGELQLELLLCAWHTSVHGTEEQLAALERRTQTEVV